MTYGPDMSSEDEKQLAYLQLLEGRRLAYDTGLWQVPALVVAGQALLLGVLTAPDVHASVAVAVALAGVLASSAAIVALWVQRDRERHYSERVFRECARLAIDDPRRAGFGACDAAAWWSGAALWTYVQAAFIAADVVALHRGLATTIAVLAVLALAALVIPRAVRRHIRQRRASAAAAN